MCVAAMWGDREGVMPSEEARHRRPRILRFHLFEMSKEGIHRDRKQKRGCQGLGERRGSLTASGYGLSLGVMEMF